MEETAGVDPMSAPQVGAADEVKFPLLSTFTVLGVSGRGLAGLLGRRAPAKPSKLPAGFNLATFGGVGERKRG